MWYQLSVWCEGSGDFSAMIALLDRDAIRWSIRRDARLHSRRHHGHTGDYVLFRHVDEATRARWAAGTGFENATPFEPFLHRELPYDWVAGVCE